MQSLPTSGPSEPADVGVAARWLAVQQLVAAACNATGRQPHEVTVIGVTKYVDADATAALFDAGCVDLGESRPQTLWDKAAKLHPRPVRWHMIGHLQRNKVARTLPLLSMLHSLDSERLANAISAVCVEQDRVLDCLIEVNISGDQTKTGLSFQSVFDFAERARQLPQLRICGMMGMAGLESDERTVAKQFARLRQTRDTLRDRFSDETHPFDQLSMGMSADFPLAIREGATMIRIGSTLFPPSSQPN